MNKIEVNALGQQCPIPVVMTTKALKEMKEAGIVAVHVDNEVAVQNVLRLAQSQNLEAKAKSRAKSIMSFPSARPARRLPKKRRASPARLICAAIPSSSSAQIAWARATTSWARC